MSGPLLMGDRKNPAFPYQRNNPGAPEVCTLHEAQTVGAAGLFPQPPQFLTCRGLRASSPPFLKEQGA
jgi:hypothetical protein